MNGNLITPPGGLPSIADASQMSLASAQLGATSSATPSDQLFGAFTTPVAKGKHWIVHRPTWIFEPGGTAAINNSAVDGIYLINPTNLPSGNQGSGPILSGISSIGGFLRVLTLLQQLQAIRLDNDFNSFAGAFGLVGSILWDNDPYVIVPSGCALAALVIPANAGQTFQLTLNYTYLQRLNSVC